MKETKIMGCILWHYNYLLNYGILRLNVLIANLYQLNENLFKLVIVFFLNGCGFTDCIIYFMSFK